MGTKALVENVYVSKRACLLPCLGVLSRFVWESGRIISAPSLHRVYRLSNTRSRRAGLRTITGLDGLEGGDFPLEDFPLEDFPSEDFLPLNSFMIMMKQLFPILRRC